MTTTARIGHNNSPTDKDLLLDYLKGIAGVISEEAENLSLEAEAIPEKLTDHREAEDLTNFVSSINDCIKRLKAMHKTEKEPHLTAGRTVDNFFGKYTDMLEAAKKKAQTTHTSWLVKCEEEERARLEKEAEQKRLAANQAAENLTSEEDLAGAVEAENAARTVERELSSGKNLTATRGIAGSTSLRKQWVGEIVSKPDIDLNALRQYLPEDALQKAINAFVYAGGRELSGVKIYEKQTAVTRG